MPTLSKKTPVSSSIPSERASVAGVEFPPEISGLKTRARKLANKKARNPSGPGLERLSACVEGARSGVLKGYACPVGTSSEHSAAEEGVRSGGKKKEKRAPHGAHDPRQLSLDLDRPRKVSELQARSLDWFEFHGEPWTVPKRVSRGTRSQVRENTKVSRARAAKV